MGLDYSFVIMGPAAGTGRLLQELAKRLSREDKQRLLTAIPGHLTSAKKESADAQDHAIRGIAGLSLTQHEHKNDYCFSFLFQPDPELCEYEKRNGNRPREDGRIPIGCVWTQLHSGGEFALIQATAATTGMSLLFTQSSSIQDAWITLAATSGGHALFRDTEDPDRWELLYPEQRRVPRPDEEAQYLPDCITVSPDSYCRAALELAGVANPSRAG